MHTPIAPRGGVMMVPLTADRAGDRWPRTLEVRLADGTRLQADVAWIHPAAARSVRQWTDDPRRLAIRAIEREDDTSRAVDFGAGLGPYALLRLPSTGDGPLRIDDVTINPIWCDVPWDDPLREADVPAPTDLMPMTPSPDRPDPESPFEYWRWVLLADRLGLGPPAPGGGNDDDIPRLAAEHYATLWRIGLARLAHMSPRIARECREALTHTALDRGRPAAAWVSDPQQAAALLSMLLDFQASDQTTLSAAVAWLDQQTPLMLWPESESGDTVHIAVASMRPGTTPLRISWVGETQSPSAVELESGIIAHLSVERPPPAPSRVPNAPQPIEPASQVLRLGLDAGGTRSFDLACGPRVIEARPPGVFFPPLTPPLTLSDVQLNLARPADPERATLVHVRRLGGRWEVFAECRRVADVEQHVDPASIRSHDDLRGIEALTVLLGPEDDDQDPTGQRIWLTVPEHDWPIVVGGMTHADLQVHKRSFGDRWTCRIVLPEAWFSAAETNPAFIGFIRGHSDVYQVETGPAPSPPWRISPARAALDLGHWDDMPRAEPD